MVTIVAIQMMCQIQRICQNGKVASVNNERGVCNREEEKSRVEKQVFDGWSPDGCHIHRRHQRTANSIETATISLIFIICTIQ